MSQNCIFEFSSQSAALERSRWTQPERRRRDAREIYSFIGVSSQESGVSSQGSGVRGQGLGVRGQ